MTKEGDANGAGVDERNSPVCVINATGTIQMVNKALVEKWGYKRDELNGKNVSMLMPNPFSNKHNTFLRNYISTGKPKILDSQREVLALHKDKFCFPIKLKVTKVSGEGADSVFMGMFQVGAGCWQRLQNDAALVLDEHENDDAAYGGRGSSAAAGSACAQFWQAEDA